MLPILLIPVLLINSQAVNAGSSLANSTEAPGLPPNVVIILMDDIGRDKLGAYGEHPNPAPTPNIDALAMSGVLFRNTWAMPTCSPTRAALLTGRHSDRTGIGSIINVSDGVHTPLSHDEWILPEALPRHASLHMGKWHLRDIGDPLDHALDAGFGLSVGYRGRVRYFDWFGRVNATVRFEEGYFPSALMRRVVRTLDVVQDPYFLYYCPALGHSPFHRPPDYLHSQAVTDDEHQKHLAMTEAFDRHFGLLMNRIDLDETFVFLIGDNGSPLRTVTAPWPFNHAKRSPYEGGIRVPMIVAGPGIAQGAETSALVQVTDVYRTVLDLVGEPCPATGAEDSISFKDQLLQPSLVGHRESLYFHQFPFPGATGNTQEYRAVRTSTHKLIEFSLEQRYEVYDLVADPHEATDLLDTQPGPASDALRDRLLALMPTFP